MIKEYVTMTAQVISLNLEHVIYVRWKHVMSAFPEQEGGERADVTCTGVSTPFELDANSTLRLKDDILQFNGEENSDSNERRF